MKFLFASDSFKGTLSSEQICEIAKENSRITYTGSPGDIPGLCLRQHRSSRWRRRNNRSSTFSSQRNNNSLESARTFMGRIDMQLWYAG